MAQRTNVQLIDDLDGGQADQTVEFALDGNTYVIDLSDTHASELRDQLAPFLPHARRTGINGSRRRRGTTSTKTTPTRPDERDRNRAIRQWAQDHGMQVAARGRLPTQITTAFSDAH